MNIEDKLPKAEDIVKEYFDKSYTIDEIKTSVHIIKAMHEYARRLLDVVAESEKAILKGIDEDESEGGWWETSYGFEFGASKLRELEERILKLKEMLK